MHQLIGLRQVIGHTARPPRVRVARPRPRLGDHLLGSASTRRRVREPRP
jgi:hypothetical protein